MDASAPEGGDWSGVRLHVVTGKGGTGKTTVAAALALALASLGRRVLLAEVEGRQGISGVFEAPPLSTQEELVTRVSGGGEIWGLAVDAKAALIEYLALFYRLGRAGGVLERLGAIDFATTIAPGVRDVLLIGKVYEAVGRRGPDDRPVYDAVVLDAPPTGRVVQFLNVNTEVADLARVGPIRHQADSITRLLRSPESVVHLVTILEEMPVQETADAVAELVASRLPVGAIVVDQAREPLLTADTAQAVLDDGLDPARLASTLASAGLAHDEATVVGLLDEARAHVERLDLEDTQLAELDALGRPVLLLPQLADPTGADGIRRLAQDLAAQARW